MPLHCGCFPPGTHVAPCPLASSSGTITTGGTSYPIAPAPATEPARAAWECIRCRAVNAPHVDRCVCVPYQFTPQVISIPSVFGPAEPTPAPPWVVTTTSNLDRLHEHGLANYTCD